MYQTIITLKKNITPEQLEEAHKICNRAYDNHAGKVTNKSSDPYILHFEDDEFFGTLSVGDIDVFKSGIKSMIEKWQFVDTDDSDESNDDVLKSYTEIYKRNGLIA